MFVLTEEISGRMLVVRIAGSFKMMYDEINCNTQPGTHFSHCICNEVTVTVNDHIDQRVKLLQKKILKSRYFKMPDRVKSY